MANTKSAKKALKQSIKRHESNVARKSLVKTAFKKVTDALNTNKSKVEVDNLFVVAQGSVMRAASKKVLHRNTASRKIARLAKKINSKFASATSQSSK